MNSGEAARPRASLNNAGYADQQVINRPGRAHGIFQYLALAYRSDLLGGLLLAGVEDRKEDGLSPGVFSSLPSAWR